MMTPTRTITGSATWLEAMIPNFTFKGEGWYSDGHILVIHYHLDTYQAHLYRDDPRSLFQKALHLPDKDCR